MSLKDHYQSPFQVLATEEEGLFVVADSRSIALCSDVTHSEGVELCSILNAHFAKNEAQSDPGGICDKCLSIHSPAFIGQKCISSKNCGGTVQDIKTPQPNREETDRVAMEFIKSGRTIQPQYWEDGQWNNAVIGEGVLPPFDYGLPWRIKPTKRRVVVELFKGERTGDIVCYVQGDRGWDTITKAGLHKPIGTIECEVEA